MLRKVLRLLPKKLFVLAAVWVDAGCTPDRAVQDTIVARNAMPLVHSMVGRMLGGCSAPHRTVVVVVVAVLQLYHPMLLLRCILVLGSPLPCVPSVHICNMLLCSFLCCPLSMWVDLFLCILL